MEGRGGMQATPVRLLPRSEQPGNPPGRRTLAFRQTAGMVPKSNVGDDDE